MLSHVQSGCICQLHSRPVTTDRVPITPITRTDVPFQVVNRDGIGPSHTAAAVCNMNGYSVIRDKEAEFGSVVKDRRPVLWLTPGLPWPVL